jgi:hypothetical protein
MYVCMYVCTYVYKHGYAEVTLCVLTHQSKLPVLKTPTKLEFQKALINMQNKQTNKLRGPYSASELYRPSDLSTKFGANFCG